MSNTEALRAAAQQALETLEQLQGGCTDSGDGTVEAITVWCPEIIDAMRAALAQPAETDAELERRTGEPHIDGYPLFSGLPPPAQPAASGELAELWALWACDQETGREHLARQGGEAEIRAELQRASNAGRDVWALDPQGRKHLPAAPQPAPALVPLPARLVRFTLRDLKAERKRLDGFVSLGNELARAAEYDEWIAALEAYCAAHGIGTPAKEAPHAAPDAPQSHPQR